MRYKSSPCATDVINNILFKGLKSQYIKIWRAFLLTITRLNALVRLVNHAIKSRRKILCSLVVLLMRYIVVVCIVDLDFRLIN